MPLFTPTTRAPIDVSADLLLLPVFEGPQPGPGVKEAAAALDADLLAAVPGFTGKVGETALVPTLGRIGARAILLVGLGAKATVHADQLRRAAGKTAGRLNRYGKVANALGLVSRDAAAAAQALVEGTVLGSYRFDAYKSERKDDNATEEVLLCLKAADRPVKAAIARGAAIADAVCLARDLVNTPSADAVPEAFAARAKAVAKEAGITCKVYLPAELEKGNFGGILGVGKGSAHPPRLVELTYRGGKQGDAPVVLVGKGVTFDSGGLSLKDAKNMEWMKVDKGGASAMLASMQAIAALRLKVNVVALLPLAENLPSGSAQRPGDVIRHRNGKTSEVLNTDAEGRLILADALSRAVELEPAAIIDAATLTGACMVALGPEVAGVFGNDKTLTKGVLASAEAEGEPMWEMPLHAAYRKLIDSPVADIKNIAGPYGGAITAALFLKEFVADTPWVHIDIAGPAWSDAGTDLGPKQATGTPVRTIVRFVADRAAGKR